MPTLDSILNVVIPIGCILFFGGVIYKSMKKPIDSFIAWIAGGVRKLFEGAKEKTIDNPINPSLNFDINYGR